MTHLSAVAPFGFPSYAPPERSLAWFARLGCARCQYYRTREFHEDVGDILQRTVDAGLSFEAMHAWFGDDLDLSCTDQSLRRVAIDTFEHEGAMARQLGAGIVIVHPSSCAQTPQGTAPVGRPVCHPMDASRWEALAKSCAALARIAEELDVTFAIENLPPWFPAGGNVLSLAELIDGLGSERLRLCFDTGHAHVEACMHGPGEHGTVVDLLSSCLSRDLVAYLHVHDNDGRADSHRLPYAGTIDWPRMGTVFRKSPCDLPCMLELFLSPADLDALESTDVDVLKRRWGQACGVVPAEAI